MAITIHSITNVDGNSLKEYEFRGLSTDTKPSFIGGEPVEMNSMFWELDTNKHYYCSTEATKPVIEKTVLLDTNITEWEMIEVGRYRSTNASLVAVPVSNMPNDSINVKVNGQEYVLPKIDGFLAYGEVEQGLPSFENYPVALLPVIDETDVINDFEVYSPTNNEMTISVYFETGTQGSNAVWTELGTAPTPDE